eukprot:m.136505 g.136505  ORF g.136505 m.136505 type:complete len:479 (-) comp29858_c0_seq2:98-1534(-)
MVGRLQVLGTFPLWMFLMSMVAGEKTQLNITLPYLPTTAQMYKFNTAAFGFNDGGSVQFSLHCQRFDGVVQFITITDDQQSEFDTDLARACLTEQTAPPVNYYVKRVEFRMATGPINKTIVHKLLVGAGLDLEAGFFGFRVQVCLSAMDTYFGQEPCWAELEMVNSEGNHLSSDLMMLPAAYRALSIFWAVILGLWFANWMRHHKASNRLHLLATFAPMWMLLYTGLLWQHYTKRVTGEADGSYKDISAIVLNCVVPYALFLLMLIAYGYKILRNSMERSSLINSVASPTILAVALTLTSEVHNYFLAITVIFVVLIIITVLKNAGRNIGLLRNRLREIEALHPDATVRGLPLTSPLLAKRFMVEGSRAIFTGYLVLRALSGIFDVSLTQQRGIQVLVQETILCLLMVSILWLLRLQNTSVYRNMMNATDANDDDEAEETSVCQIVYIPGENVACLGVEVNQVEFEAFLETLKRNHRS